MEQRDGGPAFPRGPTDMSDGQSGMSLRDWFAGQALLGILGGREQTQVRGYIGLVEVSYSIAQEMIREREERES